MDGSGAWKEDSRVRFAASVRSMLRWVALGPRSTSSILPSRSGSRGLEGWGELALWLEDGEDLGIGEE